MKSRLAATGLALLVIAGCHRGAPSGDDGSDPAQGIAQQQGQKIADDATHEARIDALEARVDALENESSANQDDTQDARLDMIEQEMAALTKIRTPAPSQPQPDNGAVPVPSKPDAQPAAKPDIKPAN